MSYLTKRRAGPGRPLVLLFLLMLPACSAPDATLSLLASDAIVLAFGDSLTYGTGVTAVDSYPSALSEAIGRTVVRSGVPGELSDSGRKRLPGVLRDTQPDLVLLLHGGNDILRRRPLAGVEQNLAAMIELCRDAGAEVVLIAVPGRSVSLSAPPLYEALAERFEIPLVDGVLSDLLLTPSMKSDAVHLNAAGYSALADTIAETLRTAGALDE